MSKCLRRYVNLALCLLLFAMCASFDRYGNAGVALKDDDRGVYIERDFESGVGHVRISPSPEYVASRRGGPGPDRVWVEVEQHKGSYSWVADPPYQSWVMEYEVLPDGIRSIEKRGPDWKSAVSLGTPYFVDYDGDGLPDVLAVGPTMYPLEIRLGDPMHQEDYYNEFRKESP